ncbi:MFS transporter [Sandaracinobacter neustonicus]|uniref:MFS transporter n=1 Tax=Sandaracinobacter neustonicus TaxID=1715348 RepID=A0A501XG98_9SPHN|nr:MFS transporter [Sandaracinobacter neustonicus]TPE59570.1 MFS transporter [Sandaracinobacter neustonicus]
MQPTEAEIAEAKSRVGGPYSWYVLGVLVLVYVMNFIDRQIMAILAEDIKAHLGVSDSELGFLYGTVFGVFYALFGIPLGRLADMWHRMRLLSIGLTLWSAMTALSGLAGNFAQLAAARIGVGVGEASASPVAYSVLSDYFPKEQRATALSIYSSGIYIGGGLSLFIGGLTVERWNAAFPDGGPFGLVGWQAAFMAVGIPGLLLALWVSTLREPIRGLSEGIVMPQEPNPFPKFLNELSSVLPPFTILHAATHGRKAVITNLTGLFVAALFFAGMSHFTGNWPQWLALGLAGYAVFSWSQSLKHRDRPTHALIWGTPSFLFMVLGFGMVSMTGYAHGFWGPAYAIREFGVDKAIAGFFLGGGGALGGFLSIIAGGKVADTLKRTNPAGRILIGFATVLLPIPFILLQYTTTSIELFYLWAFMVSLFGSLWVGVAGATAQDLVLPRMRGAATATFFLGTTVIGLGLGPFLAGRLSELLGDLGHALMATVLLAPLPLLCFAYVYRNLPRAESTRLERARAAGEPV